MRIERRFNTILSKLQQKYGNKITMVNMPFAIKTSPKQEME